MSSTSAPYGVSIETVSLLSSASDTSLAESGRDDRTESGLSVGTGAIDEIEYEAVVVTTRQRSGV